jgi:hypothetical protein
VLHLPALEEDERRTRRSGEGEVASAAWRSKRWVDQLA